MPLPQSLKIVLSQNDLCDLLNKKMCLLNLIMAPAFDHNPMKSTTFTTWSHKTLYNTATCLIVNYLHFTALLLQTTHYMLSCLINYLIAWLVTTAWLHSLPWLHDWFDQINKWMHLPTEFTWNALKSRTADCHLMTDISIDTKLCNITHGMFKTMYRSSHCANLLYTSCECIQSWSISIQPVITWKHSNCR